MIEPVEQDSRLAREVHFQTSISIREFQQLNYLGNERKCLHVEPFIKTGNALNIDQRVNS